jgi:predicted TIM-barrel fold metal-dependent hydrolase
MTIRVDSHAHVYDLQRYPFHASSGFHLQPNEVGTAEQFAAVLDAHGFTHGLLVNPLGGYGTDNRCLLDVLQRFAGRFKGVAVIAHDTPEAEFDRMHTAGIVGLRFNLSFDTSPALDAPGAARTLQFARERGWFAQVHYHHGEKFVAALPALRASGMPIVVDHCGRPEARAGLDQVGFRELLQLGREGNAWVKLSGAFRFGGPFPYEAADPYVHALIDAFGIHRCVWGSDWPFLRASHRVDHASLLVALQRWLPDASDRQKVLGDNPAKLFGFRAAAN